MKNIPTERMRKLTSLLAWVLFLLFVSAVRRTAIGVRFLQGN